MQHRFDGRPHGLRAHRHEVRRVVGAAALPGGSGQIRRDRIHEAGVRIRGHQPYPAQAAGDQVGEEGVPRGLGLAGGHLHAQHLAVPVAVDPGGQQHRGFDDLLVLADLDRQRIGGDEGEWSGLVQAPVAERGDLLIQVGGHAGDLGFRQ